MVISVIVRSTHIYYKNQKHIIKKENPLLSLLFNLRSAPQILYLKDGYNFYFTNFPVTGLCNSVANSWFDIISNLTAPPEGFLSKNL